MNALTEAQLKELDAIWRYEDIDNDNYEDEWNRGFNSAAREMREKLRDGADAAGLKAVYDYDYIDLSDERYQDSWTRGSYTVYRAVDAVLKG